MMMDPVVVKITPPRPPWWMPRMPHIGDKASKIITATAAVTISVSMVIFIIFSVLTNTASFKKNHELNGANGQVPSETTGSILSSAAKPGGGTALGTGGTTGTNAPVVTLTATPSSVVVGGTSHLQWSVTNNPTSCTASDDWSGSRDPSGQQTTQALTTVQTYLFTLTCSNATGTGFSSVSVDATAQGGSGNVATRPGVTLSANPTSVYTGETSTLIWTTTNNPTSCTASGDWSGNQGSNGSAVTARLTTARSYSYTLKCSNATGTGYATVTVRASTPPANLPIVSMTGSALGAVTPGSSVTLTWTTTNNPTSCTASGDWSGSKPANGSQSVGPLNTIKSYSFILTCGNAAGSSFDSVPVQVLPSAPTVALTVTPSSTTTGSSATLAWSSTGSPTSCTASGDWSGTKSATGSQSTGTLTTTKTYAYSLSCTNAGGTGYANNVPLRVTLPTAPVVSLSVNPISTTTGNSATLTWSSTNNPASCTASGSWTGAKSSAGSQSTGTLSTAKTYSYTLNCSNAGGSGSATTSVNVSQSGSQNGGTVSKPVVTISVNPATAGTGSTSTISWSATNNPSSCTASGSWSGSKSASGSASTGTLTTAGSQTYSLSCSNSAGSGSASATLVVSAVPVVSISISPSTITAGGTATITWSATASPTSCTAGGSWSGTKGASGTQSVTASAAGVYTYQLSCSNAGGSGSNSTVLSVNPATATYCGGKTPCYGPNDLAQHATIGNCWGYNLTWVINITTYAPHHKGGAQTGSLESPSTTCNHNIHPVLTGNASIPGYTDKNGASKHGHASATVNNSSTSALSSYFTGYYDATKP